VQQRTRQHPAEPRDERSSSDPRESARQLASRLAGKGAPLRLDGATGTELERLGLHTGLPLWSTHALLEAPDRVREIHQRYAEEGAEILTANTFRTQRRTLERAGLEQEDDRRLTFRALSLAREAAERANAAPASRSSTCWIAGSLPPLEDCYSPELVPDANSLTREHGRQAELLAEGGADLILIETMNCVREAEAASRAAERTGLPFIVSFVAWKPGRLLSGESLSEAARCVLGAGAQAVGVNCFPPSLLTPHLEALAVVEAPLLVSPNLGEPDEAKGFRRSDLLSPAGLARALAPWLEHPRLRIIGGCCGTGPRHVRAIDRALQRPGNG
jgi:S-methylmethionine-dependent homocysteine/selenocysteine methylase